MPAMPVLDTAKVAGAIVLGALLILGALRKGFGGVTVGLSD